ncbi:hypothetical protein QTH49_13360 [Clostridium perfringens]|nr:hypothetical protein [Clostridium perfringens]
MRELVVGMNVKLLKEITITEFDGTEKILAGVGATGKIVFIDNDEDCLQDCLVEWNGGFFEKGEAWYMPSEIKVDEDSKSGFWWVNSDYLIENDPQAKEEEIKVGDYVITTSKISKFFVDVDLVEKGMVGKVVHIKGNSYLVDWMDVITENNGDFFNPTDEEDVEFMWWATIDEIEKFVVADFKEGDKVEVILNTGAPYYRKGAIGTIVRDYGFNKDLTDDNLLVEFESGDFKRGEDGDNTWFVCPLEIELLEDEVEEENPIEKYKGKRVRCLVDNFYFSKGAEGTIINILSDDDLSDCYVKFDKGEFIENSDNCWYCDIERDFTFVKEDKLEGIEAEISLEDFISEFSEFMKELRSEENDKEENIEEEPKRKIKVGDVVRATRTDSIISAGAIGVVRAIDGSIAPYFVEWLAGDYNKFGNGMIPSELMDKVVKDGTWWISEESVELYELEDCVA